MAIPMGNLICGVLAVVCLVCYIVADSTSWYTSVSEYKEANNPKTCVQTGSTTHDIASKVECSPDCADYRIVVFGIDVGPRCSTLTVFWSDLVTRNNRQYETQAVLRAALAMQCLATIFIIVAAICFFMIHFVTGNESVGMLTAFKLPIIFSALGFLFTLIALIVMGAGYIPAVIRDQGGCNNNCPTLFDYNDNSSNGNINRNSRGLGVAYWFSLVGGIINLVLLLLSILAGGVVGGK